MLSVIEYLARVSSQIGVLSLEIELELLLVVISWDPLSNVISGPISGQWSP